MGKAILASVKTPNRQTCGMPQLVSELLYTLVVTSFFGGSMKVATLMDCYIDLSEKNSPQS